MAKWLKNWLWWANVFALAVIWTLVMVILSPALARQHEQELLDDEWF